jgi:hypothetical protein
MTGISIRSAPRTCVCHTARSRDDDDVDGLVLGPMLAHVVKAVFVVLMRRKNRGTYPHLPQRARHWTPASLGNGVNPRDTLYYLIFGESPLKKESSGSICWSAT